jgi:hypothetical protein
MVKRSHWFIVKILATAIAVAIVSLPAIAVLIEWMTMESPIAYSVPAPKTPDAVEVLHEPSVKVYQFRTCTIWPGEIVTNRS